MSWNISQPHHRRGLAAGAAAVLALGTLTATAVTAEAAPTSGAADHRAPLIGAERASAVDGSYIVVLEDGATRADTTDSVQEAKSEGASDIDRYGKALTGFSAEMPDSAVAELRSDPDVAYIEADQRVSIDATQSPATWGLDRIDQRNLPLNNAYTYDSTGQGVRAYVIDTGVRASHSEFGGRVTAGATAIDDGPGASDCNGHGTHVAGTIGGSTYGVAKAGHDRRRSGCSTATAPVDLRRDRRRRLGHRQRRRTVRRGEHEPRWRRLDDPRQRREQLDRRRCHLRRGGRQRERQRLWRLAVAGGRGADRRFDHQHRRPLELLQLRLVRRPVRAGLQHHLGVVHERHRHEHDLGHLDGDPARRRCGGALPAGPPGRQPVGRGQRDRRRLDVRRRGQPGQRLAEPAAVLADRLNNEDPPGLRPRGVLRWVDATYA